MSNGVITGRQAAILSRYPAFMRTDRPDKAIGEIAGALGRDLDEAERLMMGVLRSHRLAGAVEERDVLRLAALLGLHQADFLVLRKFYEQGFFTLDIPPDTVDDRERAERAYAAYLAEMKEAVQRVVRVMLDGCGTLWALLDGTSILIKADTIVDPVKGRMEHPDAGLPKGGFIHRILVRYHTVEDGEPVEKEGFVYMVENPLTDRATEDKERRQREWFRVKRLGFFDVSVAMQVTGMADRTVFPMVINKKTHEGVGFRGVVADGQKLVFATDGRAYLDGVEVTDHAYYFQGALADDTSFDGTSEKDLFCIVHPAGSLDRNYPRPAILPEAPLPVPTLRLGESDWRFSVQEGAFDASGFNEAVFQLPDDPAVLNALPPSGKVQLRWWENEPFAVSILIPRDLKSLETAFLGEEDLRKLVRAGLERYRAAGIRLDVDYFNEKWVLGESVIKDIAAMAGEGVNFAGTLLGSLPA